jgi:hypothetical protein
VQPVSIPPRRNPTTVVGRKGQTMAPEANQGEKAPTFNPRSQEKTRSQPTVTKRELFQ